MSKTKGGGGRGGASVPAGEEKTRVTVGTPTRAGAALTAKYVTDASRYVNNLDMLMRREGPMKGHQIPLVGESLAGITSVARNVFDSIKNPTGMLSETDQLVITHNLRALQNAFMDSVKEMETLDRARTLFNRNLKNMSPAEKMTEQKRVQSLADKYNQTDKDIIAMTRKIIGLTKKG